jgi:hypothetical protein
VLSPGISIKGGVITMRGGVEVDMGTRSVATAEGVGKSVAGGTVGEVSNSADVSIGKSMLSLATEVTKGIITTDEGRGVASDEGRAEGGTRSVATAEGVGKSMEVLPGRTVGEVSDVSMGKSTSSLATEVTKRIITTDEGRGVASEEEGRAEGDGALVRDGN